MNNKQVGKKKLRSKIVLKLPVISAFFGSLGPYFNKQATLDSSRWVYSFFIAQNCWYMIYPFDFLCIFCMLWVNTISVKYKMLSYKYDGAFIGTTLMFVFMYVFSSGFDYLYDQELMPLKRVAGALCIVLGVVLISLQEDEAKVNKKTQSFVIIVEDMNKDGRTEEDDASEKDPSSDLLTGKPSLVSDATSNPSTLSQPLISEERIDEEERRNDNHQEGIATLPIQPTND